MGVVGIMHQPKIQSFWTEVGGVADTPLGSPSEGSQQVRGMGRESGILQMQMHGPGSRGEQPQAPAQTGDSLLESSSAEQHLGVLVPSNGIHSVILW